MKIRYKTIMLGGMALAVLLILLSIITSYNKNTPSQKLLDFRKQKDHYFRTSPDSPIANKENFKGLIYFEPTSDFKVKANLTLLNDTLPFFLSKNDARKSKYVRYAIATFMLNNQQYNLTLLKLEGKIDNNVLFIPFSDKTNGGETYEGGRYLDVRLKNENSIVLDFNLAYNPYCAYNYKYSCPIPPRENVLSISIEAGEKKYPHEE
ncbi:MAG TPA: DUF1684 domain-containing protein [Cytophagaceae bacterium]|nr:DUF1684 domain-containing protein [Cytophagaceae bacterium]